MADTIGKEIRFVLPEDSDGAEEHQLGRPGRADRTRAPLLARDQGHRRRARRHAPSQQPAQQRRLRLPGVGR